MKLSQVKTLLPQLENIVFQLENGTSVPKHFHITEVGVITKDFIDCGGQIRHEKVVNLQLWSSVDLHHRLQPNKLLDIINLAQNKLAIDDLEIEVEYQNETIGKYGLDFKEGQFLLTTKKTDCLALENCGIPAKVVEAVENCCTPGGSCC